MNEQTKRLLSLAVIFLVIVGGAYFLFQDSLPSSNRFVLSITDCKLDAEKEIKVKEGDEITLLVTADKDSEFHIHGYDLKRELVAGQEERIVFKASDPGTYDFELEKACELGILTVTDEDGNVPNREKEDSHQEKETGESSHGENHN